MSRTIIKIGVAGTLSGVSCRITVLMAAAGKPIITQP
jgi:hypothetical protein